MCKSEVFLWHEGKIHVQEDEVSRHKFPDAEDKDHVVAIRLPILRQKSDRIAREITLPVAFME